MRKDWRSPVYKRFCSHHCSTCASLLQFQITRDAISWIYSALRPFFPTTGVFCLMHHKTQMEVYMEKWQTSTMKMPKNLPLEMSDHRQIQIRPTRNPHKTNLTLLQPPDTPPKRGKWTFFDWICGQAGGLVLVQSGSKDRDGSFTLPVEPASRSAD